MRPVQKVPVKCERGPHLRIDERVPGGFGLSVGNDVGDNPVGGRRCNGSEQSSEECEGPHS